ncbi:hypothetical protein AMECASPLE_011540 [Ameca splendens]|uniref:Uncharacterized protein n=1 Tax=Ameca splendens TaxID=208324 RepID=A0ABV0ZAE0_9TELE
MNSHHLLWTDVSGWQRSDSSLLGLSCDQTLLTLHCVHLPSRPAKIHHAVPSSPSSWINFTLLWLIIGSQTPLVPPWRFTISSPCKHILKFPISSSIVSNPTCPLPCAVRLILCSWSRISISLIQSVTINILKFLLSPECVLQLCTKNNDAEKRFCDLSYTGLFSMLEAI